MCPYKNDVVFKVYLKHYSTEYPAVAALYYRFDYSNDCSFDSNDMLTVKFPSF